MGGWRIEGQVEATKVPGAALPPAPAVASVVAPAIQLGLRGQARGRLDRERGGLGSSVRTMGVTTWTRLSGAGRGRVGTGRVDRMPTAKRKERQGGSPERGPACPSAGGPWGRCWKEGVATWTGLFMYSARVVYGRAVDRGDCKGDRVLHDAMP